MSERDEERVMLDEAGALDRPPGLETQRLRSALQARLFGTPTAPTRIGRYVVVEPLGQGAMGTVYRAIDPDLDRRVAVKVLRDGSGSELSRSRLAREAKIMARLTHPNVVAVYEVGVAGGEIFIAMESVDGGTLADWCTANALGTKGRSARVLELALQAARGLAAAHGAGLVHRDLKPTNLLIGEDGRLRVADFGLARPDAELMASESGVPVLLASATGSGPAASSSSSLDLRLTATGEAVGTPAYMAPEQFTGRADATSDQFAFCVTFFEALYGVRPFAGRTTGELLESIAAARILDVPSVPGVPAWVRRMLRRGLACDPTRRWRSMAAIVAEIERRGRVRRSQTAGLVALGGLALSAFLATRASEPDPIEACAEDLERLDPHWGDERREAMRAAFTASGARHADDTWARVQMRMDEIAQKWGEARVQACRDGRDPDPERVAVGQAREECLERALGTFELVAETFVAADEETVQRAVPILLAAADQIACDDRRVREHDTELDEAVFDALDEAALLRAGRRAVQASAVIEAVLPRLPPTGYLRAKALQELVAARVGVAAPAAQQRGAAMQALEAAELIDDAVLLAHAWRWLAHAEIAGEDYAAAERAVARARNIASRPEVPELDRARVRWTEATVLEDLERFTEAATLFDAAIEVYRRERPDDAVLAYLLHDATASLLFTDAPDRAAEAVAEAVATCERVLGPLHPETGSSLVLQAQIDHQLGRPDVLETLDRAEKILLANPGARADVLIDLHMVRSHAHKRAGRSEESLAAIDAAIEIKTQRDGPDAPFQLMLGTFRADALEGLERYEEARAEYRRLIDRFADRDDINRRAFGHVRLGLAYLEAHHGDRSVARTELAAARAILDPMHDRATAPGYYHFLNIAKVMRGAGDLAGALEILEDLARRLEDAPMPDRIVATVWLDTAHTHLAGGDRQRAREAIERAREPVRAADPEGTGQAVELAELEASVRER
jgi:tetratricopeptide (TPR) repeat protein/tRNA A-37 threonylcarbamoyl transferase component Bud32